VELFLINLTTVCKSRGYNLTKVRVLYVLFVVAVVIYASFVRVVELSGEQV